VIVDLLIALVAAWLGGSAGAVGVALLFGRGDRAAARRQLEASTTRDSLDGHVRLLLVQNRKLFDHVADAQERIKALEAQLWRDRSRL
jgi:hypothetical protein